MALIMKPSIRLTLSILSGLLLWSGFAPIENALLPILGGSLLFYLLADQNLSYRFTTSIVTGLAFLLPLLHWSSTYVGAVPWLILSIGEGLLFALIALVPFRRNFVGGLLFSAIFVIVELIRMKLPFGGFGWGRIGFTQVDTLNHLYPLVGVTGVTFSVMLICSLITLRKVRYIIGIFLLFIIGPFVQTSYANSGGFSIAAVQGGVTKLGLDFNSRALEVLQSHINATDNSEDIDLILWPENSVDIDPASNEIARDKLSKFIANIDTYLLTGTVEKSPFGPRNAGVLYSPDGVIAERYVKQDLAPFGEYIPLRSLAEKISIYARNVNDFVPGDSWQPMSLKGKTFQSFICFEVLDDDHVRAGAKDMDFLIAQTNNATFGKSSQAAQQLQITRARAAELRKEFAVVSTTGFTVHLDRSGDEIASLDQFEPATLRMEMSSNPENTLASRLGTGFWAVFAGLILLSGYTINRR